MTLTPRATKGAKLTNAELDAVFNQLDADRIAAIATASADATSKASSAQAASEPANANIQAHIASVANPHVVTKAQVGLGSADNTADSAKPVSTAQASADTAVLNAAASDATTKANAAAAASVPLAQKGAALGVATLDAGGLLPTAQLPPIAVVDYLGAVANQTAMLLLVGQKGDWCTRTDLGTTWLITGADPTLLASWTQLSYPTAPVTSVAGKTGAVTLVPSDVGAQPLATLLSAIAALAATGLLVIGAGGTASTLAAGTANQIVGMNAAGTALENKSILGTANQITVTHAVGSITLSLPQDIHTAATPTFAGLTNSALTATRVTFADTAGLLSDSQYLTYDPTLATGKLAIGNTTDSTSTTTGALTVAGGLGVAGQAWAGSFATNGTIWGVNFHNSSGIGNADLTLATTGTIISRDVADANTLLTVNQVHASSTGLIADFQVGGVSKFKINNLGGVTIADTTASTSTTTGALTVAGGGGFGGSVFAPYFNAVQTVDQEVTPSVYGSQTASTLQTENNTGVDEVLDNVYEAIQFTASGAHNIRSIGVRLKASATLTNPTAVIYGRIYTDVAGSPGALISGTAYIRLGSLTTSYVTYQFAVSTALVNGTSYWLVIQGGSAATGGTVSMDRVSTGTGRHAYSPDGTAWTLESSKTGWFALYGRSYYGVYGTSTNSYGVYGISTNNIGVYGTSTNSYGVYGTSTNSYGVYGTSTNSIGVYGISTNNIGVYGISTNSYGVYGISTNSYGVYGTSTNSYGGIFYIGGVLTANNSSNTVLIRRYPSGAFNVSGNVLQITDNPTVSGTKSGALISGQIEATERLRFDGRVADGASAVAHFLDTDTALSNATAKLFSLRNAGAEKLYVTAAGGLVATAGFGCNGKTAQTAVTVNAAATDLATSLTLLNQIRAALIADGIAA